MDFKVGHRYTFEEDDRGIVFTIIDIDIDHEYIKWSWVINGNYGDRSHYPISRFEGLLREGKVTLVDVLSPRRVIKKFTL